MIVNQLAAKTFKGTEPLFRFVARQFREMREGGSSALMTKLATLSMMVPAAMILLAVFMARPLVLIRFGSLMASKLGAFAVRTEHYLCVRDAGISNRRTLDIFFFDGAISNQQLKSMWQRILLIAFWAKWPRLLALKFPFLSSHVVSMLDYRDVQGFLERTPPHLSFTAEEEAFGQAALRQIGIPEEAPFICFFSRDSAYYDFHIPVLGGYNYRDSSIHSYTPAVEELTLRGYYTLRMGAIVKEPLISTNPMIVDYATKHRTDFLDIYLASKCRFFLGACNGFAEIPALFRRPLAIVNFPLDSFYTWGPEYVLIPKKFWLRNEHRFMTFRENLELVSDPNVATSQYEQLGIETIDNTPEEITAVVVEMDERLNGTWQTTDEDETQQRKFWALLKTSSVFESSEPHGAGLPRVGAEFLRQNLELLE